MIIGASKGLSSETADDEIKSKYHYNTAASLIHRSISEMVFFTKFFKGKEETVYGLAGNAYSNKAVKKIFSLKKRPAFNPLIIHFKNLDDLKKDVIINEDFIKLYKTLCPGPITFILKKKKKSKISKIATAKKNTVAIRIPKHNVIRNLLNNLSCPLAAPSANIASKLNC